VFKNKALATVFLIIFIDLLGFSLILPLLPYYAAQFDASAFEIGLLVASFAATQFIAAPFLGRLSDRFGRRPVLLLSIFGNAIGFIILGLATNLWILFGARLFSGLLSSNISVAQAYISDVTEEKDRARGLGLIGAAFGLGFIIGPAIGGFLSRWGYDVPSFVAAGLAILNFAMVIFWLPESLTAERRAELAAGKHPPFTLRAMLGALRRPEVGPLLTTRFFFAMAFSTLQTIFALWGLQRLNLSAQQTGFILTYVGFLSALVQGVLIGRLTARFSEKFLIFAATVLMAGALFGWSLVWSVPILLIVLAPVALAGGVLNTVINSAISKSVSPIEVGGTLGLSTSLESLTRVFAPTIGGLLLQSVGSWAPGVMCGTILVWLATYVWRNIYHPKSPNPYQIVAQG
jgi:MFS transporter, DHA1 family, tetracycline resistance protein